MANLNEEALAFYKELNSQLASGGAVVVSSLPLEYGPIYENATHKFYGETYNLGAALNASVWRVSRVTKADNQLVFADGNANFDNVYTSLVVVEALTYPGGA